MRALILETPGTPPSLSISELPDPTPAPGEAVVRVAACGFCHHDRLVMSGTLRRGIPTRPVLGHEIAGVVHEVADGVTALRPGDRVVSLLTNSCGKCDRCRAGREHRCRNGEGIGHGRSGGFAEFVAVSEHSLVPLPAGLSLEAACLLACPAGVALQALRAVSVSEGEAVVVIGAGGGSASTPFSSPQPWEREPSPLLAHHKRLSLCTGLVLTRLSKLASWTSRRL